MLMLAIVPVIIVEKQAKFCRDIANVILHKFINFCEASLKILGV